MDALFSLARTREIAVAILHDDAAVVVGVANRRAADCLALVLAQIGQVVAVVRSVFLVLPVEQAHRAQVRLTLPVAVVYPVAARCAVPHDGAVGIAAFLRVGGVGLHVSGIGNGFSAIADQLAARDNLARADLVAVEGAQGASIGKSAIAQIAARSDDAAVRRERVAVRGGAARDQGRGAIARADDAAVAAREPGQAHLAADRGQHVEVSQAVAIGNRARRLVLAGEAAGVDLRVEGGQADARAVDRAVLDRARVRADQTADRQVAVGICADDAFATGQVIARHGAVANRGPMGVVAHERAHVHVNVRVVDRRAMQRVVLARSVIAPQHDVRHGALVIGRG